MATDAGLNKAPSSNSGPVREAVELVDFLQDREVTARIFGGVAIVLHCDSLGGVPHRELADIDLILRGTASGKISAAFEARGYEVATRFNAMHGDTRMMFSGPAGKVDVFIDQFSMCHRIDLRQRLDLDYPTLTVSDLLLTKLQIVELNEKDANDIAVLLGDHELGDGPGDWVDMSYLSSLLSEDWGLWRTVTGTLDRVAQERPDLRPKLNQMLDRIEATDKSRKFKLRARIGDKKRWYELPEDTPEW